MDDYKIKMGIANLAGGKLLRVEYDLGAGIAGETTPTTIDYPLNGGMVTSRGITKRVRSFVLVCKRAVDPDGFGTLQFVSSLFHSAVNNFYFQDIDGATTFMVGILNIGDYAPKPKSAVLFGEESLWTVKMDVREK